MKVKKSAAEQFRRARSNELRSLAQILDESGVVQDTQAIYRAASQCSERRLVGGTEGWGYEIDTLVFPNIPTDELKNLRPDTITDLSLTLSLFVEGKCLRGDGDPLTTTEMNVVVHAETGNQRVMGAWHFDRHLGAGPDPFAHPLYHFQFGGRGLDRCASLGDFLCLEPPRLAHPPIEGVLAIDLIISNYFANLWMRMREEARYADLLREAQLRMWKPYAQALLATWRSEGVESSWDGCKLWPQLVS